MTRHARKNNGKKVLIMMLVLIVIISLGCFGYWFFTDKQRLLRLGYSKDETSSILENLNKKNINALVRNGYIKDIMIFIENPEFDNSKFNKYLSYFVKYSPEITVDDTLLVVNSGFDKYNFSEFLVSVINDDDFESTRMDSYFEYHDSNSDASVSDVVFLVNLDINRPYSVKLIGVAHERYFINGRLDRYLEYASKHEDLGFRDVVLNVNTNRDYNFYSNIQPVDTSKETLMLINKYYNLPNDFYFGTLVTMENGYTNRAGAQLNSIAYNAFKKLVDEAGALGYSIRDNSAYRSFYSQTAIYNDYLNTNGQVWTDTWSARPGHSEHQTGLALDVGIQGGSLTTFENTREFDWMRQNAHKYGFILRYPQNKEHITGYGYEPWHYRYVGVEVATYIFQNNITFDEYYAYYVSK